MNTEKEFVDGMIIKKPHENAPDWVKAKMSLKLDEFKAWVSAAEKADPSIEWINIDIKQSQGGKLYAERDNWKPEEKQKPEESQKAPEKSDHDDIPW